jgi:putative intracellular protease/amidase
MQDLLYCENISREEVMGQRNGRFRIKKGRRCVSQQSQTSAVTSVKQGFSYQRDAQGCSLKRRETMRKIGAFTTMVLMMAAILAFSSPFSMEPTQAFGQSGSKVLMIPREGYSQDLDLMISMEVGVMTRLLNSAGYTVDVATTSGYPIVGPTRRIEKVVRLQDVNVNDYVGVIMPCMAVGLFPGPPVAPEAVAVVKKALADGKPVGAALGSINVLAEAGVLKGKKYAYYRDPMKTDASWAITDPRFADALYSGPGTTQDGKIITCGVCPNIEKVYGWGIDPFDMENGPVKLTKAFIGAIGSQ